MSAVLGDPAAAGRCFDFALSTILSSLLVVLVLRSGGEHRVARIGYAACALLFDLSALVARAALALGYPFDSPVVAGANDLAVAAAAAWPISLLAFWSHGPNHSWLGRRVRGPLLAAAGLSAVALTLGHACYGGGGLHVPGRADFWPRLHAFPVDLTAYNAFVWLWLGAAVFVPRRLGDRAIRNSTPLVLAGISLLITCALVEHAVDTNDTCARLLQVGQSLGVIALILGGLVAFARFRFSDVFAQQGLRILLGASLAFCVARVVDALTTWGETSHPGTHEVHKVGIAFVIWIAILAYAKLAALTDWLVDRQLFRRVDHQATLNSYREQVGTCCDPDHLTRLTTQVIVETLRVAAARVVGVGDPPPAAPGGRPAAAGARLPGTCPVIPPRTLRFPVLSCGGAGPGAELEIRLESRRHTLFSAELAFVREVCFTCGRRLEALDRESERVESARREAKLRHQVTEAELRALRAQINPHFLFNSLNTIAALIAAEPQTAEEMTVRLAKIFRHVLTHHNRLFSLVGEEMTFLRTYLDIEQVRFGDRLQVRLDWPEDLAHFLVPSLILQPLVENSLKHGLAPKRGRNELTIRARRQDAFLELTVEDNGAGAAPAAAAGGGPASTGLGLRNVEERLQTVYRGRAEFSFVSEPARGSRASIRIPLEGVAAA